MENEAPDANETPDCHAKCFLPTQTDCIGHSFPRGGRAAKAIENPFSDRRCRCRGVPRRCSCAKIRDIIKRFKRDNLPVWSDDVRSFREWFPKESVAQLLATVTNGQE